MSSWPHLFRVTILAVALGAGSGVVASALTSAYLVDYASQLGELSSPLRFGERVPRPAGLTDAVLVSLRERVLPSTALFYAAAPGADGFDLAAPERVGVVLTSDGWMLTSAESGRPAPTHVVVGREAYAVERTAADPVSGTLFVKVAARNLPTVAFGGSEALAPADLLFVADGARALSSVRLRANVRPAAASSDRAARRLHVDVALPGSPVYDADGELVGLAVDEDGAVPVETFLPAFRALLRDGAPTRGTLGLTYRDLSLSVGLQVSLPTTGLLVTSVGRGSAAEVGGVRAGDVLVSLDGRSLDGARSLDEELGGAAADQTVTFVVDRNGERRDVRVTLR